MGAGPTIDDRDVLLVVDVQADFCPGGALPVAEGDAVVPVVTRLAERFRHVVLTQDWHPPDHRSFASVHAGRAPFEAVTFDYGPQVLWPDHCVQDTPGAAFHPGLVIPHAALVLRKGFRRDIDSYSAFFENDRRTPTGLGGYLRERGFDRVVVVGLAFDFCVRWSAEDGRAAGFDVVVVEEGCRGIDLDGSVAATRDALVGQGVRLIDTW
ncbi:bifunctional nicotinamidase/pyrazinamidase [Rhodoplanes serenus]|jgi:nicotinamidase/pyrazinamidase|uniref:bifunctional nicotinamidase/pyrazinamidase n=1 Tax=Rhodoplanes serenus TaxID=200615 RepID=UPI000DABB46A|nr:bifunctional nicotinamidase/pyrazinamidase [Rhodoplanes serenus]RAI32427.1 nicotinamidase [Rhodoplanes serenus]